MIRLCATSALASPESNPLCSQDNVILTLHVGRERVKARQRPVDSVADNVANILLGDPVNAASS